MDGVRAGGDLPGQLGAFAATRVLAGAEPGSVYWEEPDEPALSGWVVLVGDESQDDADDAANFQIFRLDTLTAAHPRLRQLFRFGVRGTYDWDPATNAYRRDDADTDLQDSENWVVDFRLADAEERHAAHPQSFLIPDRAERDSLQTGDSVRLLFELLDPAPGLPNGERMWVEVTGRDAGGYRGVLTNAPAAITTIGLGDDIRFGPENVIATFQDPAPTPDQDEP